MIYKPNLSESYLIELFDEELPMTRNKTRERELKKTHGNKISGVESYDISHGDKSYHMTRFKNSGAWEVHFGLNDSEDSRLDLHKGSGASKIVGTALKLYKEKLDNGEPIRFYGDDESKTKLYDSVFRHLNKTQYNNELLSKKVVSEPDEDGTTFTATQISRPISPIKRFLSFKK